MEKTGNNIWLLLFLSLAMGLLVGLQRQSVNSKTAGIRTFPLITITGTVCGLLSEEFNAWILVAGFLAVTAMLVIGNIQRPKAEQKSSGITTEIAVLLMYAIGAYIVYGESEVAVVLTGIVTVLLHFKTTLHGWIDKIGESDLMAIMQFVLISMVILPVLPDTTYDPYESLNPKNTWWMVVLIVGISLSGYFLYKIFGNKASVLLGGILGGLISSTATTVSYSKTGSKGETAARLAAFVILTASTVSLVRVLVEISIVAPSYFKSFLFPLAAELFIMVILVGVLFFKHKDESNKMPEQENPAQIKSALIFTLLFVTVSFISAVVRENFGNEALYPVAIISGLTDLDAITLSTAKMTEQQFIDVSLGWRLILVATLANLIFKASLAIVIGKRMLGRKVITIFGVLIAAGLIILFIWPS